jgi:hypothetical protein
VTVLINSPIRPLERAFTGERIDQIKLLPHDHPSTALLLLGDGETAVLKAEIITVLAEKAIKCLNTKITY